jgi:hypothetical protein
MGRLVRGKFFFKFWYFLGGVEYGSGANGLAPEPTPPSDSSFKKNIDFLFYVFFTNHIPYPTLPTSTVVGTA